MRARLAHIMQIYSYGPSYGPRQTEKCNSPIPRAREPSQQAGDQQQEASKRNNTRARTGGWGGARNRKYRETTALTFCHAEGILKAMAVAELNGTPLNRHWTVNYEWCGINDRDGAAFVGRLLAQASRYARRRGGTFAAVWVREIGVTNGGHVHIAFHWPRGWRLGSLTRKWIKGAGGRYRKNASRIVPIGGWIDCANTSRARYRANLENLANYMVKGSAECVAEELGLRLRKTGGRVIGKRCGRTQNLRMPIQTV